MKKYKFLDHTADVMFESFGKNLDELFRNSALAIFDIQCNLKKIGNKTSKKIKLKNENAEDLLFDFIEELIYLKDKDYVVFGKFKIKIKKIKDKYILECIALGEKIDPKKHELKTDIKAITLHEFYLKKTSRGWKAKVLVDI